MFVEVSLRYGKTALTLILCTLNIWSSLVCCCASAQEEVAQASSCHQVVEAPPSCHGAPTAETPSEDALFSLVADTNCACEEHFSEPAPGVLERLLESRQAENQVVPYPAPLPFSLSQARAGATQWDLPPPDIVVGDYLAPSLQKLCRYLI